MIIMVTIFFRLFYHPVPEKGNPILVRLGFLTPSEYANLNKWLVTFLFNTKHMFSERQVLVIFGLIIGN